jgi:2-C-methyl-D-erythritol 2,4-cyclodiphosphate synthase
VTDSKEYLRIALGDLETMGYKVSHVSVSLECLRPKILPKLEALRVNVSKILGVTAADVALTATSGEGLTDFGKGLGIQAFAVLTAEKS